MEVAPLNGSWFAWSGNRRLWVIQRLQSEGHIAEVLVLPTQKSISSRNYKLSTKNGGMSVRVRGVLQMSAIGGERTGWSMQQANSTRPGKETEKEQTAGVFIVQWIGSNTEPLKHNCQATKEQVMKCTDEEFIRAGDVMKAVYDLNYGGRTGTMHEGTHGTVVKMCHTRHEYEIQWTGQTHHCRVKHDQVKKCAETEFIASGNVIKAAYDLDYGSKFGYVAKGAFGVVKKVSAADIFIVQWIGSNTEPLKHNCQATKEQVMKCTDEEFIRAGDVMKAVYDLNYGGRTGTMHEGTHGTVVKMCHTRHEYEIQWTGQTHHCRVKHDQVKKCAETEFIASGNVIKAAYDLDYGSKFGYVAKGALGVVS